MTRFQRRSAARRFEGFFHAAAWAGAMLCAVLAAPAAEEEGTPPVGFAKEAWKSRWVEDLKLDSPVELAANAKVAAPSEETRKSIEKMAAYSSGEAAAGFQIVVTRTEYKPGFERNVDGSVEQAIKTGAAALGDVSPRVVLREAKVPGMASRRAAYHGKVGNVPVHLHSLGVADGTTVWAVLLMHFGDEREQDAERILGSVRIHPEKK